jgi:hypothetical protein
MTIAIAKIPLEEADLSNDDLDDCSDEFSQESEAGAEDG